MVQANQANFQQQIDQIVELVNKNNSGLIVLPANPSVDAIAASTALYLGLTKLGKTVSLVCATTPQSELIAADKIQQSLTIGGDNLVVSFPYVDGAIDKVDYNIQGDRFNLVIIPRERQTRLEPKKVEFSYAGGKAEFIITVDVPNLNSIGPVYQQNQREFEGKSVINIDRHLINNNFGMVNYVNKTSSSTTELVLGILESLKVEIDKDMATNMYAGLLAATNSFTSYSVNAETFQTASKLLRYGAVKRPMQRPINRFQQTPQPYTPMSGPMRQPYQRMNPNPMPPMTPMMDEDFDEIDEDEEAIPAQVQRMPPIRQQQPQATPQRGEQQTTAIEEVEKESQPKEQAPGGSSWLKPKIFPGKGLI